MIALALAGAVGLGGCASVMRGTDEQIAFASEPAGALKVARKDDFTATFTKEGFKPESVRVRTRVSGEGVAAGAGNIFAGGIVGIGVDAYNGANLDHTPNPVFVQLSPLSAAPVEAPSRPKPRRSKKRPAVTS